MSLAANVVYLPFRLPASKTLTLIFFRRPRPSSLSLSLMASCEDDFSLLGEDNPTPHHHQSFASHRFAAKSTAIHSHAQAPSSQPHPLNTLAAASGAGSPKKVGGATAGDEEDEAEDYSDAAFCSQANSKCAPPPPFHDVNPNCFAAGDDANPFAAEDESDPNKARANDVRNEKRKDREELSDGGTPYSFKKQKSGGGSGSGTGTSGGGDYRKDREEWSDSAIDCLLDAYTEKFVQLNRGNLRGRDWEEVSSIVSDRCDKTKSFKSVEQCKNKVDNLKKRYKVERHRMSSGGSSVSHWPWFKKMEQIVGNSSKVLTDEDRSAGASTSMLRQSKSPRWRRVVFKVSGAALAGNSPQNTDPKVIMLIAREVSMACRLGVEVAIVVGGRNFFCGDTWVTATGLDRSTAYQIGMMATVMNSILLQSALEKLGVQTRIQTAFPVQEVAEPYNRKRAVRHLEKGRVVIFGGIGAGTGNPLFTTDTAAALRASEVNAEAVLKGTNVDVVYDCHSRNNNNVAFEHISFRELASRGITSMDMMAITFCEENGIPVVVFNLHEPGNISRALCGDQVGTLIDQTGRIS
ncbi:PREDICTED: uncharacterized protein LOC104612522 isoform X2 [Nelumbo nucifera]|uniref:UMP kinase n=2 Tax=Nelumbo nucifera TaxID=4432 RepID=A0A1U8BAD1_NELNU|nr:PREDICTED: uncharacterized protein LOC104612522 isoform X2 [Nelumbo nucifera]